MIDLQNLKKIRMSLGLTQHAFAKRAAVSQSLITKIESGKVDPTYSKVKQIEEAIHLLSSKQEKSIAEIMTRKIVTVNPEEKALEAIKIMNTKGISQLPVVEGNNVIGMLSEASALEHAIRLKHARVKEIMAEAPPIVSVNSSLTVVSTLLKHHPMVMVKKQGLPLGVITKSDLLQKAFS